MNRVRHLAHPKEFDDSVWKDFIQNYQPRIAGWPQTVLILAGFYNILFGLWAIFLPEQYFALAGIEKENLFLWQCVGMIVGLYGLGYLIASGDIERHWPIIFIGLLGKIFGPIGFIFSLLTGQVGWDGAWILLTNDLIWWIPFTLILLSVVNSSWRESKGTSLPLGEEASEAFELFSALSIKQAKKGPLLTIFLRHKGCTFCGSSLRILADELKEIRAQGYEVVLVHMGKDENFRLGLEGLGLGDVNSIADKKRALYTFFRLHRTSFFEAISPKVIIAGLRAMLKYRIGVGSLEGDGFQLSGTVITEGKKILTVRPETDVIDAGSFLSLIKIISKNKSADEIAADISKVRLFFDGKCALCSREIAWLKSLTGGSVTYEDIEAEDFDEKEFGIPYETLVKEIKALDPQGKVVTGMQAFREVYKFTPYGKLFSLTAYWPLKPVFDLGYKVFAKNRIKISSLFAKVFRLDPLCEGSCSVETAKKTY